MMINGEFTNGGQIPAHGNEKTNEQLISGSGLVEKGLAYWIYYEDDHTYYCENCIDKRVDEINTNKEFSENIDYDGGDTCGYYQDWADEDYEVECCKCSAPLLSKVDDV